MYSDVSIYGLPGHHESVSQLVQPKLYGVALLSARRMHKSCLGLSVNSQSCEILKHLPMNIYYIDLHYKKRSDIQNQAERPYRGRSEPFRSWYLWQRKYTTTAMHYFLHFIVWYHNRLGF